MALLLWVLLVSLRRSRARFALVGAGVLGLVYLVARRAELELTATILQGFFAVFVVFVVVAFQEDLRRLFERVALWGLRRRAPILPSGAVDTLVRSVARMAETRTGALLVIPGKEPVERLLEGGHALDAWLSEALLLSLFDPGSPGHDGAVVLSGNRVVRFGVHLPLSADRSQLDTRGTRHAAALGLSEHCDAFVIAVSEERGTVSCAHDGELRTLPGAEALAAEVAPFLEQVAPAPTGWLAALRSRVPEGAAALAVAVALWFLLVPGSAIVEVTHPVPVKIENLPPGYVLLEVAPSQLEVTVSGLRRELMLKDLGGLEVRVDALLAELGRRTFQIEPEDVAHPPGVEVTAVTPSKVKISLQKDSG